MHIWTALSLQFLEASSAREAVKKYIKEFNPNANKKLKALWKAWINNVIEPDKYPLGSFNNEQWIDTQDTLFDLGLLKNKINIK